MTDPAGFYVPKERHTVQFEPTLVAAFGGHLDHVGKLVASSQDFDMLAGMEGELQTLLGEAQRPIARSSIISTSPIRSPTRAMP